MILRFFLTSFIVLNGLIMRLSANDTIRFDFFADTADLISPKHILAPDLSGQRITQGFELLATVDKGEVKSIEIIGADTKNAHITANALRGWQFLREAKGRFVLLARVAGPLPTSVCPVESLDNRPIIIVKATPSYPHLLRAVISWSANVEVTIDPNGIPVLAKVLSSSGVDYSENAAIAALFCRFAIGLKNGTPIAYKTRIEISYDATQ
jgi:hypothetical protein